MTDPTPSMNRLLAFVWVTLGALVCVSNGHPELSGLGMMIFAGFWLIGVVG